jgi:hypothetical protein
MGCKLRITASDPKHWQRQAKTARADAKKLRDPSLRLLMLAVALGYEALAVRVQQKRDDARREIN